MAFTVELPLELQRELDDEAVRRGVAPAEIVRDLLERELGAEARRARMEKFLAEAQAHAAAAPGTQKEVEAEILDACREARMAVLGEPRPGGV